MKKTARWRIVPLIGAAGGACAATLGWGMMEMWVVTAWTGLAAFAATVAVWLEVQRLHAQESTVSIVVDPRLLENRRVLVYGELSKLKEAQDLQSGVFEVGAELVGCVDEADAYQRFGAAIRRYWSFSTLELWVWERGSWRCIGSEVHGDPAPLERPVQLPAEPGGDLIVDLSAAVSGQAALIVRGAYEQPSLTGRSVDDKRWVAEVLRSQLALSLRRVLLYGELNALARVDPLTGAHRRWYGESRLDEIVESGRVLSVAMVDLDHFKSINDTHGHAVGDKVLAAVGRALTNGLRLGDLVCRYGGEEFLVILPDTLPMGAQLVADRLRTAVSELKDLPRQMTVSVGVASCHQDEATPSLIERADQAMYQAKRAGRDRIVMADNLENQHLRTIARPAHKPVGESSTQRSAVKEDFSEGAS